MTIRHVTPLGDTWLSADLPDSTPPDPETEGEGRFRIYRLCTCGDCHGNGRVSDESGAKIRCKACRGEGRSLELVATATDPESVGVALVTLAREDEFSECPIGLLDRPDDSKPGTWLIKPWLPSPRNVSDAGRLLRAQHP